MIEISDLVVGYGTSIVLHGVSLTIASGSITSLLGPNGAGKTTMLRAISGLIPATRGSIECDGIPLHNLLPREIVARGIAHVPEGRQIFPDLSVKENLCVGGYPVRAQTNQRRDLERVFAYFPRLRERCNQRAGTLSGGEQQMLAVGRALMAVPRVLLLDEPSTGLAPILVRQLLSIIRELRDREGLTVMLVEPNPELALGLADFAYVLVNGRIVTKGPAATLMSDNIVRAFYLGRSAKGRYALAPSATGGRLP